MAQHNPPTRHARAPVPARPPLCPLPGKTIAALAAAALALVSLPGAGHAAPPERLTLDELVQRTLQGPRARMAYHETRTAEGRVLEARGARYPRLTVTPFVAPSPDIECANPDCTRTIPEEVSLRVDGVYAGARISAVQPVYTFGKLGAITHAAQAAAQATARLEDATAADLAVEAARAYYGLKLARELVWMLEDGLAEIEGALARAEERLAEGSPEVTIQDRLRIETLRAEVAARLSEARQAEAVALAGIRALAGAPGVDVDEQPLAPVDLTLAPVETYLDQAVTARPEVRAARAGAEAARARAAFEAARYLPDLVVVGEIYVARAQGVDDPPSAFASDPFNTTTAAVGLALRWELDMTQRGRVAQARAQAHKAGALVELAEHGAGFELRQAYAEASEARARVEASAQGQRSARGWVAAVLQAEAVGTAESKDLADAFIAYFTLRARHVTSIFEWNLATVRLRRAVGEFTAGPGVPRS